MSGTPDYDEIIEYPIGAAAYLLFGMDPPEDSENVAQMPPEVRKVLADLKAFGLDTVNYQSETTTTVIDGEARQFTRHLEPYYTVRKDLLRQFAERNGWRKRAPALFPEDRPDKDPGPATVRTLYAIIGALTRALAETDPARLKKPDGRPLVGCANGATTSGVVGHLIEGGFTGFGTRTLETHIGKALNSD